MRLQGVGKRLTIYCGEADRYERHSLAHAIVERALEEGLAGATVVRGIEGFGATSHLHTSRILSLSGDLPIIVEIVDREDRVMGFLPIVDRMVQGGLVTIEDLEVCVYRSSGGPGLDDNQPA